MKKLLFLFSIIALLNLICCFSSQKEAPTQLNKINNIKSTNRNNLSEGDMNSPSLLASEGWKIVGYTKWDWELKNQITIARLNRAELLFNRAIKFDQYNADAVAGLAKINLIRGGDRSYLYYNKKSCQESLDLIKKSGLINTDIFNMIYMRSEIQLGLENYDDAIREAERIQETSNGCLAHFLKSRIYYEKFRQKKDVSDKDSAILESTDYLECLQNRNQDNIDHNAYVLLWSILSLSKDYDSTIEYFKSSLDNKPYSPWSYRNYVWVLLQRSSLDDLNNAEMAINKAKKTLNLEIDSMQLYSNRGRLYLQQKKYGKAYEDFNKLLSISPLAASDKDLLEVCSHFKDNRCIEIWQRRIKKHLEFKTCKKAKEEFDVQYKLYPQIFEPLKKDVENCKPRN